jgi:hypothetical protein
LIFSWEFQRIEMHIYLFLHNHIVIGPYPFSF